MSAASSYGFGVVALLIATACTEVKEPVPYTYSKTITGETYRVWEVDYFKLSEAGKADELLGLSDCEYDDQYYFYADDSRSFEIHNGREKCDEAEEDILYEDSWAVINATATIEFIVPFLSSEKIPWTIEDIDDEDFEVSFYWSDSKSIHVYFKLEEEGEE